MSFRLCTNFFTQHGGRGLIVNMPNKRGAYLFGILA